MKALHWTAILFVLGMVVLMSGCATQIGKPTLSGAPVTLTEIDCVNGEFIQYTNDKTKKVEKFNPDVKIGYNTQTGWWDKRPRLWVMNPLLGGTLVQAKVYPFIGLRYFSLFGWGLHLGADKANLVPTGVNFRTRWGPIVGVQLEIPWDSVFTTDFSNVPALLGIMAGADF